MTESSSPRKPSGPAKRAVRLALAGSGLLLIAAIAAFYAATRSARGNHPAAQAAVQVVIEAEGCNPGTLAVPAGTTTFRIVNHSDRAVEWEILDGVMVVEERENIAPGYSQMLTARLQPGKYAITCGLLSKPRGTLQVTPTDASEAIRRARPALVDFIGPLAEYRVYIITETNALLRAVRELSAAIGAFDLRRAQSLYARAALAYKHIEPAADLFADLDTRLDARADYFEKSEQDPQFTGFHRIEYALFAQRSLDDLSAVADQLVADVQLLQARVRQLAPPPGRMSAGAARLMDEIARLKIDGMENRYAHTDLFDFQANLDGARKVYTLLRAFVDKKDPSLASVIDSRFDGAQTAVAAYRQSDGFVSYDTLDTAARQALASRFHDLSAQLFKVDAALGFD